MAGASDSGKPLVIKAKNKEELMKQLEGLVADKGKKALLGHIEHLVCNKSKVVQCQLPKNKEKGPTPLLITPEVPVKAENKSETLPTISSNSCGSKRTVLKAKNKEDLLKQLQRLVPDRGKKSLIGHIEHLVCDKGKVVQCQLPKNTDKETLPPTISRQDENDLIQNQNVPAKEEMPKAFSFGLFVTAKDRKNITFEEFMSAAHEFGTNAVEASGNDLRGYLSHLNFLSNMAATGKYSLQVHLDYDKAIRLHAQEIGWPAFKADNTTVANLYYSFDHGTSEENADQVMEPDLELTCSDGHQSDLDADCSTSNPTTPQFMQKPICTKANMNEPQWQSVTKVSTDPTILQYIKEDNDIAEGTQHQDKSHLPQSVEMMLVTQAMETSKKNKPHWQSVTAVSTDPTILQYRKDSNSTPQGAQDDDPLPQSLEITLVTKASPRFVPKKVVGSTTDVIKDDVTDHSAMSTTLPKASVSRKRIQKRHMCTYCAKRFICASELEIHLKTHIQETYHICAICSKIYTSEELLRDHFCKHPLETEDAKPKAKGHICPTCDKQCESYSELTIHIRQHTGEPDPCIRCNMKFISSEALYQHMLCHNEKQMHVCSFCEKRFSTASALTKHTMISHPKKNMQQSNSVLQICSYCGKRFYTASKLKIHTRIHTGEKPCLCSYCGKRFNSTTGLKMHIRCHTGEKPHKCSECGKGFSHLCNLRRHRVIHTMKRPYLCQYCAWGFKQPYHLTSHIRSWHTGERCRRQNYTLPNNEEGPHTCTNCRKQFRYLASLKVHMITHTGGDPLTCPECGKKCSSTIHLRLHMMKHTEERPFKCPQCSKAFTTSTSLDSHTRIHTGEKPYVCSDCGKAFSVQGNLQRHKKIHTGERNFVCSYCGKAFGQKDAMRLHIMIHTGEKPFVCAECGKGFIREADLRKHLKVHGEKTA